MLECFVRIAAAVTAAFAICSFELPALADGTADVYQRSLVPGANDAIKSVMMRPAATPQPTPAAALGDGSVAQSPPGSLHRGPKMELPGGRFEYRFDVNTAYPYGNIGSYGKGWLMGGFDASVGYGFNWSTRLIASVFQLQHWPYGFNTGLTPVYLAGFQNPVGCADLENGNRCGAGAGRNINVRTKDTFGVFMLQKMFVFRSDKLPGPVPIVISPTYVVRSGQVGFSPDNNDVVPVTYNLPDGPVVNIPVRTAQYYAVGITLPFLKTPKMFGTFTLAPQWLVHTAGANVGNSMQVSQVVYLEYTPLRGTTLFFEPQSLRDYLPTDPYPEHLITYFLGASQQLTKYAFVSVILNSGNTTNLGPIGIVGIKCLTVQQAINNACGLAIGGLKATQLQFQIGIGTPHVFPL
jgi:hypothetical protein